MNKPGDVVMIFGSPVKLEHPIDQAKLLEKKRDSLLSLKSGGLNT